MLRTATKEWLRATMQTVAPMPRRRRMVIVLELWRSGVLDGRVVEAPIDFFVAKIVVLEKEYGQPGHL
jgi:hypothetical protein